MIQPIQSAICPGQHYLRDRFEPNFSFSQTITSLSLLSPLKPSKNLGYFQLRPSFNEVSARERAPTSSKLLSLANDTSTLKSPPHSFRLKYPRPLAPARNFPTSLCIHGFKRTRQSSISRGLINSQHVSPRPHRLLSKSRISDDRRRLSTRITMQGSG